MIFAFRQVFRYGLLFGFSSLSIFLERSELYRKAQQFVWKRRIPREYRKPHIVILGSGWGAVGVKHTWDSTFTVFALGNATDNVHLLRGHLDFTQKLLFIYSAPGVCIGGHCGAFQSGRICTNNTTEM